LKEAKNQYRLKFEQLNSVRAAVEQTTFLEAETRAMLVRSFENWASQQSDATLRRMAAAGGHGLALDEEDEMDAGEVFEKLRSQGIDASDPDSGAYLSAMRKIAGKAPAMVSGPKAIAATIRKAENLMARR